MRKSNTKTRRGAVKIPAGFMDQLKAMNQRHVEASCLGFIDQIGSAIQDHPDVWDAKLGLLDVKTFRQNFCFLATECFADLLQTQLNESMHDAWLEELLQATATRCGSSALEKALKTRLSEMREETNDAWRKMDAERGTNSNETAHDS